MRVRSERGTYVFNRGLTRERFERCGLEHHVCLRRVEPRAHVCERRRNLRYYFITQQGIVVESFRRGEPAASPCRHARHAPLDAVVSAQLVRLFTQQRDERAPDVAETEKAEVISFHLALAPRRSRPVA